ncbi:protein EMSY-LIKE 4 isoform X3 [Elaeis guineensis]|uniref:Protein EMSY-LIKE 4 isoform X3 n=1 Tax=Elaeis guineensis var. tenera TaxID=51953 RepID=A0A6I9RUQ2_ELAGV|nr:protein EMSY-LIKE 4 isoform X3 [Elaeis guineensis]
MEYLKNDSSGTDDDLPNHQIIQNSKGVLYSGAMRISSGPVSHGTDLVNMEFQIHRMEAEAYGAVLRAFIAQSDVLSWGKEGLISELRKELRVSDVEHREILGKINSDDSIKSIRELRKNADAQVTTMNASSFDPNSISHISRKKLKPGHMTVSLSPKYPPHAQPSPTAAPSSLATHAREDHWSDKASVFSPKGDVGQALTPVHQRQAPSTGKARGSLIVQTSKKGFVHSGVENLKPRSDIIEILATDQLIHEVERICSVENPDPAQIEKVKIMLRILIILMQFWSRVMKELFWKPSEDLLMYQMMTHLILDSIGTLVESQRGTYVEFIMLFMSSLIGQEAITVKDMIDVDVHHCI